MTDNPFRPGKFTLVKPFAAEHAARFAEWYYDHEYRFFFRDFSQTLAPADFVALGEALARGGIHLLTILDRESGAPIGAMTYLLEKKSARIYKFGIMLDKDYQGRAWAIEAIIIVGDYLFMQKKAHKLTVEFCDEDKQIHRITKKGGFNHDATLKEELFVDGRYYDEVRYSITEETYRELYMTYLDGVS